MRDASLAVLVVTLLWAPGCPERAPTTAPDGSGTQDGGVVDGPVADRGKQPDATPRPDASAPRCRSLPNFSVPRTVSTGAMVSALVDRTQTWAAVQITEPASSDASLFFLELAPTGITKISRVATGVRGIEWLGDESAVLVQVLRNKSTTS